MNRPKTDQLGLLNSAIALVTLIPILIIAVSIKRENIALSTKGMSVLPHDQPPIIVLRESGGYSFPSGSAELSPGFRAKLVTQIIPRIRETIKKYRCDIIEVVGHTDSQRVITLSTTDGDLLAFVNGLTPPISPGSNADLGLLRAWTLVRFLRDNGSWQSIAFYGYSAGQVISPTGQIVDTRAPEIDPDRRRIEIRVRRSR